MTSTALFHSLFLMKEVKVDCLLSILFSFFQFSFSEVQTSALLSPFVLVKVLPLILPNSLRQSH